MNQEAEKLANEILNLSRNKLLVNLRFMDVALSYHKRAVYEGSLATDGKTLFFDPGFVLRSYKNSQEEMLRLYLHIGRALKENPADAWAAPYIDAVIEADKKAVQKAARPKITIDLSGLEKIRRDAAGTRDSLLTEEELDEPEALVKTPEEENASALGLDPVQIQILRALLRGEDVTKLLKANHLMPSMAADFINEALFDEIGDTVVACEDDRLTLIEDYSEDLAQLLGGTNHG